MNRPYLWERTPSALGLAGPVRCHLVVELTGRFCFVQQGISVVVPSSLINVEWIITSSFCFDHLFQRSRSMYSHGGVLAACHQRPSIG